MLENILEVIRKAYKMPTEMRREMVEARKPENSRGFYFPECLGQTEPGSEIQCFKIHRCCC